MAAVAWVAVLIQIITMLITMSPRDSVTPDELERILHENAQFVLTELSNSAPEETTRSVPSPPERAEPPAASEIPTPKTR